jgi:hypothetical protein
MGISSRLPIYKNSTATALFGVAAIQAYVGFLAWWLFRDRFDWFQWVITFSAFPYIALGIAAHSFSLSAALVGAALYAAFLVVEASLYGFGMPTNGLRFTIPAVVLLVVAIVTALVRRSHARRSSPTEAA